MLYNNPSEIFIPGYDLTDYETTSLISYFEIFSQFGINVTSNSKGVGPTRDTKCTLHIPSDIHQLKDIQAKLDKMIEFVLTKDLELAKTDQNELPLAEDYYQNLYRRLQDAKNIITYLIAKAEAEQFASEIYIDKPSQACIEERRNKLNEMTKSARVYEVTKQLEVESNEAFETFESNNVLDYQVGKVNYLTDEELAVLPSDIQPEIVEAIPNVDVPEVDMPEIDNFEANAKINPARNKNGRAGLQKYMKNLKTLNRKDIGLHYFLRNKPFDPNQMVDLLDFKRNNLCHAIDNSQLQIELKQLISIDKHGQEIVVFDDLRNAILIQDNSELNMVMLCCEEPIYSVETMDRIPDEIISDDYVNPQKRKIHKFEYAAYLLDLKVQSDDKTISSAEVSFYDLPIVLYRNNNMYRYSDFEMFTHAMTHQTYFTGEPKHATCQILDTRVNLNNDWFPTYNVVGPVRIVYELEMLTHLHIENYYVPKKHYLCHSGTLLNEELFIREHLKQMPIFTDKVHHNPGSIEFLDITGIEDIIFTDNYQCLIVAIRNNTSKFAIHCHLSWGLLYKSQTTLEDLSGDYKAIIRNIVSNITEFGTM